MVKGRILIIIILLLGSIVVFYHFSNIPYTLVRIRNVEQFLPRDIDNISFIDEKGNKVNSLDYKGNIVVISYWATWCRYCLQELPEINRLAKDLSDVEVVFFPVLVDEIGDRYANFIAKVKHLYNNLSIDHLKIYYDSYQQKGNVVGFGVPYSIILNTQGKAVAKIRGETDWNSRKMKSLLSFHADPSNYSKQ